ncbi:MAG: TIGR03619 family F420-dependent LLM class oxidoreductase [Dehalococcoidia bacterium]
MKFDIGIPSSREGLCVPVPYAGPEEIIKIIQASERLGYDAIWGPDFITRTKGMGGIQDTAPPNWYELLITLAYAAAVTERVKLGAFILLPYRDPIILAKQVAALDQFSKGRLLLGVGLGMARDEFEAIRTRERKAHRGKMMDEKMESLHLLLSHDSDEVSFRGEYVEFQGVNLHPKPVQDPLPVYVPGTTPQALPRIARWGSGLMMSAAKAPEAAGALSSVLKEHGRTLSEIDVIAEAQLCLAPTHEGAVEKYRNSRLGQFRLARGAEISSLVAANWIGTPDEAVEKINKVKEKGITHFNALHTAGDTVEETMEQMQMFAEEVIPLCK